MDLGLAEVAVGAPVERPEVGRRLLALDELRLEGRDPRRHPQVRGEHPGYLAERETGQGPQEHPAKNEAVLWGSPAGNPEKYAPAVP